MLNVQPKPLTPPAVGFSTFSEDGDSEISVEEIRVDKLWQSTDTLKYYASTDSLHSQKV